MTANNDNPANILKLWLLHQRNKHFLKKWAARRDGDTTGKHYIKRHYDLNFSFYDLYWYVKTTEGRRRVYTHYMRIHEDKLLQSVREVEEHELPAILAQINGGGMEHL